MLSLMTFLIRRYLDHRDLHSFPTRALPISVVSVALRIGGTGKSQPPSQAHSLGDDLQVGGGPLGVSVIALIIAVADRKSTRLNSSHVEISYAVFCLKKKKRIVREKMDC